MMGRQFKRFQLFYLALLPWLLTAVQPYQQPDAGQSQAEYEFGQSLNFSLQVKGDDPISAVTLFFQSADLPATNTVSIPVDPGLEITATYAVDLTQFRLAPFTTVTYWWQVEDTAGNILEIPDQSFIYEDDRFDWHTLEGEEAVVRWTGEDIALGQVALDILSDSLPRLAAILPDNLPEPLRIYIYPSAADLQSSLLLTGRQWVGGHTDPELGVIAVTAANARTAATDLRQSIPHELTHLMLFQATGTAYETLPAWFNEGLASIMEANPDPNRELMLQEAISDGSTIPFDQLCADFPQDGRQAVLAYAQSESLVRFIQTEYGNSRLNQMIMVLADGADCESVVTRTVDMSLEQLNQDWLGSFNPQPPLLSFLRSNGIWLLLVFGGFGLMALFLWPINKGNPVKY